MKSCRLGLSPGLRLPGARIIIPANLLVKSQMRRKALANNNPPATAGEGGMDDPGGWRWTFQSITATA